MIDNKLKYAVVGFSLNPEKYGHIVYNDLKSGGFQVYPVNIKGGEFEGKTIYKSLKDIPFKIDVAVSVVPPAAALMMLAEAESLNIKNIWFQPGSESEEVFSYCHEHNLNCVSGACIMVERKK